MHNIDTRKIHFLQVARQLGLSAKELMQLENDGKINAPESHLKGEGRYYTQAEILLIMERLHLDKGNWLGSGFSYLKFFLMIVIVLVIYLFWPIQSSMDSHVTHSTSMQKDKRTYPSGVKPKWLHKKNINSIKTPEKRYTDNKLQEQQEKGVLF